MTVPADDGLRAVIAAAMPEHQHWCHAEAHADCCRADDCDCGITDSLDRILALPEVAALLADTERVKRVRELAEEYERHAGLMQASIDSGIRPDVVTRLQAFEDAAASIRQALDGDES